MKRIGFLYPSANPISPANWSGTPQGLAQGFSSLGMEVVPIPCRLPATLRFLFNLSARIRGVHSIVAQREPWQTKARSRSIAAALRRLRSLDAIVAMGTDLYDLSHVLKDKSFPVATYDDGNLLLFLRCRDSDLSQAGYPVDAVKMWAQRQASACRRADVCCVSTEWAGKSFVEDFAIPCGKVFTVGIGHRPRSVDPETRSWTSPKFLFVGIDWKRKNGAAVVEAFARVREKFPSATLDLVGGHPAINAPGVTGHGQLSLRISSEQRLLDQLFNKATAFVMPSLFEPAGVAYLEAASTGLPVIATKSGGASELLGDVAININPHDHEELVRSMIALCDMDTARAMGTCAYRKAANSTWPVVSGRIAEILSSL
jgi:glycosyltransferase involved in cell wall biosynthesis